MDSLSVENAKLIPLANQACHFLIHLYKNDKCVVSQECQTMLPYSIMYCTRGTEMHTWQPHSMCCWNSIMGNPGKSFHQTRTHAECFSTSNA